MHRKWIKTALCAALLISAAPVAGSGEPEEPHSQYRVLEWNDLVPEGWEPPVVSESFDEISADSIDKDSVVQELDHLVAVLVGAEVDGLFHRGDHLDE